MMITKESENKKMCLFCASDYHLEMILLPYIQENINTSNFVILTQADLEPSMKKLLDRVNIDKKSKEKVWSLNWKEKNISKMENFICSEQKTNIVINGDYEYIKNVNNYIKTYINKKSTIIDCFHVGDINVNIDELSKQYECILNTKKVK